MARKKNRKRGSPVINFIIQALIAILVGAAIRDQLRRPPQERTWHGTIAGFPYDFRIPTLSYYSLACLSFIIVRQALRSVVVGH